MKISKELVEIKENWFSILIDDCKTILVEHSFAAQWALIEGYHHLGKRILEEHDNFEREKIYGEKILQRVATSLGKGERSIAYAVKFAKKFPDLNALPEGKNINWRDICHKYIPELKQEAKECPGLICPKCGFKFLRSGQEVVVKAEKPGFRGLVTQKYFYDKFKEKLDKDYVANFGKDGKIFKDLRTTLPDERVIDLINKFFDLNDDFTREAGYTVGVFKSQINKLNAVKNQSLLDKYELKK